MSSFYSTRWGFSDLQWFGAWLQCIYQSRWLHFERGSTSFTINQGLSATLVMYGISAMLVHHSLHTMYTQSWSSFQCKGYECPFIRAILSVSPQGRMGGLWVDIVFLSCGVPTWQMFREYLNVGSEQPWLIVKLVKLNAELWCWYSLCKMQECVGACECLCDTCPSVMVYNVYYFDVSSDVLKI